MTSIAVKTLTFVASLWCVQAIEQAVPGMPVPEGTLAQLRGQLFGAPSDIPVVLQSSTLSLGSTVQFPLALAGPSVPSQAAVPSTQRVGMDLPPEAMTMPWASLKGSLDKIGKQVEQIQLVSSDISSLQSDLRVQTKLWHQAEIAMHRENEALKSQIAAMEVAVSAGAHVFNDSSKVKGLLLQEESRQQKLRTEKTSQASKDSGLTAALEQRKADLGVHLKEINASAYAEVNRAESQKLQLRTDSVALKHRGHNLAGRIFDSNKQMVLEEHQSDIKLADLRRQLADMRQELAQLKAQLAAGEAAKLQNMQDTPALREKVDVETRELLRLQQVHSEMATECNTKTQERDQALFVEQVRYSTRHTQTLQFCNPILMQSHVLKSWLSECQSALQPVFLATAAAASDTPAGTATAMSLWDESPYEQ